MKGSKMTNNLDSVQEHYEQAMACDDPLAVNEMASAIAELTHFETLSHIPDVDTVRRHADMVVHLLHRQRELLGKK